MHIIVLSTGFKKDFKKYTSKDLKLKKRVTKTIETLKINPYYKGLKTHKAESRLYGEVWSTIVTGI